ncbi:MAG: SEL1-like repeat protein [Alphaproteobacteria bacterium]|nr:SEL1-like repeat protein [Alphaproteobacteria bacterium]MBP7759697.1 SEL1-like repeat protein [Alphaproteobacteria bacterium]MBP7762854.1 SEL1-like repeat protein [Alphaproteobacteria bacterium]MBP7905053.1 SEL1-like repeat protein [Alphaproteobacteria bacterium]
MEPQGTRAGTGEEDFGGGMSRRGNIITLTVTALILGGIFYFVKYDKTNPLSLIEFNSNQYQNDYIANLMRKAQAGDPQAMLDLATAYEKGKLVPRNDEQVKLWRKTAIEALEKKAEGGDVQAMFFLGLSYRNGKIVGQSDEIAFDWFKKGAESGHAPSQYNLGATYLYGLGTEKNVSDGVHWLEKAAEQQMIKAYNHLCDYHYSPRLHPENLDKAAKYCLAGAKLESQSSSARTIGQMYLKGQGVPLNKTEAAKWLMPFVDKDTIAQYALATLYETGEGVEKDVSKALELYEKAARKRYFPSFLPLARLYEKSDRLDDYFIAGDLLKRTTFNRENIEAHEYLQTLSDRCSYLRMMDMAEKNRVAPCIIAAVANDAHAQFFVGYLYYTGKTLKQNNAVALEWFKFSAQQGNILGQTMLSQIYYERNSSQIDLMEAYAWSTLAHAQEPDNAWEETALKSNQQLVLDILEEKLNANQKQQALERAEEYRKKYEKKETPP